MKILLVLMLFGSATSAKAAEYREDLNGAEALLLFHQSVVQIKADLGEWLKQSKTGMERLKKSSTARASCLQKNSHCETALRELKPSAVVPLRFPFIFRLDRDLKTKYRFDVTTGLRIFQLSTGLRWMVRENILNGVPMPKRASASSYRQYWSEIEKFHQKKSLDLKKASPMIPPVSRRR